MACPTSSIVRACDFPQFLVNQVPQFDEMIMEDIRPTDGWIYNVKTGTVPVGTPVTITQDRFRSVFPNTTKAWSRVQAAGNGCTNNPCDPVENLIGMGADRLEYYAEQQTWATGLFCYDQDMHITHAKEHIGQVVSKILKPATVAIQSSFLRKRALQWASRRMQGNSTMSTFTYEWSGPTAADEIWFDTSADPATTFKLAPQMLMHRFDPLMREGYDGLNPFRETLGDIELVASMSDIWSLEKLAGQTSTTPGIAFPSTNFRFERFPAASNYWRYGFTGRIGNFAIRADEMQMRFNYITDLGAGAHGGNGNRYRYGVVLPYVNSATTGAGGAAGIGSNANPDFDAACFTISFITHKVAMELLVPDATPLHPDMPFGHRDFGGRWQWQMDNLPPDASGNVIANPWRNKGRFASWFKFYVRPLHTEFMEAIFHKRERPCIPEHDVCLPCTYPAQSYSSVGPDCDAIEG